MTAQKVNDTINKIQIDRVPFLPIKLGEVIKVNSTQCYLYFFHSTYLDGNKDSYTVG